MADTFTGNYSFTQPEVGSSTDTWGGKLNTNWGNLDTFLNQFVGMTAFFPATGTIDGWLKANGQTVSRTTYARLWGFADTSGQVAATEGGKLPGEFGPGDGATTFSLPDLRGYFVRCYDDGAGVDSGRTFGDAQGDQNQAHDHGGASGSNGAHDHGGSTGNTSPGTNSAGSHSHSGSTNTTGNHNHGIPLYNFGSGQNKPSSYNATNFDTTYNTNSAGAHSHSLSINSNGAHSHTVDSHSHSISSDGAHTHSISSNGGSEARVKNVALTAYIRY